MDTTSFEVHDLRPIQIDLTIANNAIEFANGLRVNDFEFAILYTLLSRKSVRTILVSAS